MSINSKANRIMRAFPNTYAFEMGREIIVQTINGDLKFDLYESYENIEKSVISHTDRFNDSFLK